MRVKPKINCTQCYHNINSPSGCSHLDVIKLEILSWSTNRRWTPDYIMTKCALGACSAAEPKIIGTCGECFIPSIMPSGYVHCVYYLNKSIPKEMPGCFKWWPANEETMEKMGEEDKKGSS